MIRYSLVCDGGHGFESWFRGSDDFDAQSARGLVSCPICDTVKVTKQLMAPAIARTDKARKPPVSDGLPLAADTAPEQAAAQPVALIDEKQLELRAMLRELRKHVSENSENVGKGFADEARKIHYGETEQRSIYGEASAAEAKELQEEGVAFHPLPVLPDDRN